MAITKYTIWLNLLINNTESRNSHGFLVRFHHALLSQVEGAVESYQLGVVVHPDPLVAAVEHVGLFVFDSDGVEPAQGKRTVERIDWC